MGVGTDSYAPVTTHRFKTQELSDFHTPINQVLAEIEKNYPPAFYPRYCCLSAAGPVSQNRCRMSNIDTIIDGEKILAHTGLKTLVINDFMALSYSLPLLDTEDPDYITKLEHSDGSLQEPKGEARVVIGAGTGLGVGYQVTHQGKIYAFPSEGGHYDFAAFDEETEALKHFVMQRQGQCPGTELFISGKGITNIYHYFREAHRLPDDQVIRAIDNMPEADKPAHIAEKAHTHEECGTIMQLFIRMYGKYAGNIALTFLPSAGLFLAGGIVTKNEDLFSRDNTFMQEFEKNYKPHIRDILQKTPVYIIRDYSVSLFGAAHAGWNLL
jgi:glucokinase